MSLHIEAKKGEISSKILLPGDPLRAKAIAEKYLKDAVCYNNVRGMLGFTGYYKGEKISVQGTGMGMPSFSIYANELMDYYGVKRLIRVGTCGALTEDVHLRDLIIADSSHTDSGMNKDRFPFISFSCTPSFSLLNKAYNIAKDLKIPFHVGSVFSSDKFYDDRAEEKNECLRRYNTLAVEMESAELYTLSKLYKTEALAIMTVSDHLVTNEQTSAREREQLFFRMIDVALETLLD